MHTTDAETVVKIAPRSFDQKGPMWYHSTTCTGTLDGCKNTARTATARPWAAIRARHFGQSWGSPSWLSPQDHAGHGGALDGEAEKLTRKAVEMALAGDIVALRLCLDRTIPPRRDRPVLFALPAVESIADVVKASAALLGAVASGELTPSEAAELGKLIEAHVRAIEVTEIQERLARLEAQQR